MPMRTASRFCATGASRRITGSSRGRVSSGEQEQAAMFTNASTSRRSAVAAPDERRPRAAPVDATARWMRRIVAVLLIVCSVVSFVYAGLSVYIATRLAYEAPKPLIGTPAAEGLDYRDITFPSREDHLQISGWFIPGHLPSGRLTTNRTILMVHGSRQNRTDPAAGALALSAQFVRHGFAVLAFDMRGMGVSPPAPFSLGYFEQRDVLGAVDFLRSGPLPYPELGRTHAIGGWGISMGAATLLLAAPRERAIQAVVSDSAYAPIPPILDRQVPHT